MFDTRVTCFATTFSFVPICRIYIKEIECLKVVFLCNGPCFLCLRPAHVEYTFGTCNKTCGLLEHILSFQISRNRSASSSCPFIQYCVSYHYPIFTNLLHSHIYCVVLSKRALIPSQTPSPTPTDPPPSPIPLADAATPPAPEQIGAAN